MKKLYAAALIMMLLLQGCISGKRDMARFQAAAVYGEEPVYQAKAAEFVRFAQEGEVNKMLEITSALSYASQTNSVRSLYADQVVPEFKGTDVTWRAHGHTNRDDRNNVGMEFTGTAYGKKNIFV